jgi:hypothetical protein
LLEKSRFGVCFGNGVSKNLHSELMGIIDLSPAEPSIKLLDVLHRLSLMKDKTVVSSTDMRQYTMENSQHIDTV